MKKTVLISALFMLIGVSCSRQEPYIRNQFPDQYTLAIEQRHGKYYDSIDYNVVSLDLYSEGLTLDENNRIKGTGYNLFLSDIFVTDTLVPGEYCSDTTAKPFTFLPGRDYEGTPNGMYILYIVEDKLAYIQVLDSGSFVYRNDSLRFTLYYPNDYGYATTYETFYTGHL